MKCMHLLALAAAALVSTSCVDGQSVTDSTASASELDGAAGSAHLRGPVAATGEYDAIVDFTTLTLTPRGRNCLLQVDGQLVFSGTIEGAATGTTTALVFAPCSDVATSPPGTYADVFKSELVFEGTIAGVPAAGDMMYQGRSEEGGRIEGRVIGSKGIAGVLHVDAQLAVGGVYSGSLVVH